MTATVANKDGHSPNEMSYIGFTSSASAGVASKTTITLSSVNVAKAEPSIAYMTVKNFSVVPLLGSDTKRSVSGSLTILLTD